MVMMMKILVSKPKVICSTVCPYPKLVEFEICNSQGHAHITVDVVYAYFVCCGCFEHRYFVFGCLCPGSIFVFALEFLPGFPDCPDRHFEVVGVHIQVVHYRIFRCAHAYQYRGFVFDCHCWQDISVYEEWN